MTAIRTRPEPLTGLSPLRFIGGAALLVCGIVMLVASCALAARDSGIVASAVALLGTFAAGTALGITACIAVTWLARRKK